MNAFATLTLGHLAPADRMLPRTEAEHRVYQVYILDRVRDALARHDTRDATTVAVERQRANHHNPAPAAGTWTISFSPEHNANMWGESLNLFLDGCVWLVAESDDDPPSIHWHMEDGQTGSHDAPTLPWATA